MVTVNLFLDENIIVGGLLKSLLKNESCQHREKSHREFINGFETTKEVSKLIKSLFNIPTRIVVSEKNLIEAIKKIKECDEYKRYLDPKKIKYLELQINKERCKRYGKSYHIRIDGTPISVIREEVVRKYQENFDNVYDKIVSERVLEKTFDNGDINLIKTLIMYSDERKRKRGEYTILLTEDRKMIKCLPPNSILRILTLRYYSSISTPKDLYKIIIIYGSYLDENKSRITNKSLRELLKEIELLNILYYAYLCKLSIERKNNKG